MIRISCIMVVILACCACREDSTGGIMPLLNDVVAGNKDVAVFDMARGGGNPLALYPLSHAKANESNVVVVSKYALEYDGTGGFRAIKTEGSSRRGKVLLANTNEWYDEGDLNRLVDVIVELRTKVPDPPPPSK